jgi:hypothetical protein
LISWGNDLFYQTPRDFARDCRILVPFIFGILFQPAFRPALRGVQGSPEPQMVQGAIGIPQFGGKDFLLQGNHAIKELNMVEEC